MWSLLLGSDDEAAMVIAIVAIVGGIGWGIIHSVNASMRKTRAAELRATAAENEARLKAMMLQRGMSADEIERVLNAQSEELARIRRYDEDDMTGAKTAEERITATLASNGYEGADIERILRAAKSRGPIKPELVGMIRSLAGSWTSGKDIERIVLAQVNAT